MAAQSESTATDQVALPADSRIVSADQLVATPYRRSAQYGGTGGDPFADDLTEVCRLAGVIIRSGSRVDAITAVWQLSDGSIRNGATHGGGGGSESKFDLNPGETIIRVEGRSGSAVDQLAFYTSAGRKFGPYGGKGGDPFSISPGTPINGFIGRSGSRVDAFGVYSLTRCG